MVSFATGEQTKTLEYTVVDDAIAEGTETIIITLDNATGVGSIGSQNSASRLITDNDTAVITVNQTPVNGDEPSTTSAVFTIETSNQASYPITLSCDFRNSNRGFRFYSAIWDSNYPCAYLFANRHDPYSWRWLQKIMKP